MNNPIEPDKKTLTKMLLQSDDEDDIAYLKACIKGERPFHLYYWLERLIDRKTSLK